MGLFPEQRLVIERRRSPLVEIYCGKRHLYECRARLNSVITRSAVYNLHNVIRIHETSRLRLMNMTFISLRTWRDS